MLPQLDILDRVVPEHATLAIAKPCAGVVKRKAGRRPKVSKAQPLRSTSCSTHIVKMSSGERVRCAAIAWHRCT